MTWKITKNNSILTAKEDQSSMQKWIRDNVEFDITVNYGKKIDIASLRKKEVYQTEVVNLDKARKFFDGLNLFNDSKACPVCKESVQNVNLLVEIWSNKYLECQNCFHVYSHRVPTDEAVTEYYSKNIISNTYYTNIEEIDLRIKNIYQPKLDWIVNTYKKNFGREPKSILDLGAGSGHFVETAKRFGLQAYGLEIDQTYVNWAKQTFGLNLYTDKKEILQAMEGSFDIVTSFNVIEHINDPNEFMQLYSLFSGSESLIITETPKVNSLTTELQRIFPDQIRGHLMPYIHLQLFSDSSLFSLMTGNGFVPKNVWYFGQDMSELFYHLAREIDWSILDRLGSYFNSLQAALDRSASSDLMIFAAVKA